jgi:hypothetical protein
MPRRTSPRRIELTLVLALAACSSPATIADGPPAVADAAPDLARADERRAAESKPADAPRADGYCEAIVDAYCGFYLRCGRAATSDPAECRAAFLEGCNARYEPQYAALVQAGLLELSAAGVQACVAHLASVKCEQQIHDLDGPCQEMWIGRQGAGKPCGFDVQALVCDAASECTLSLTLCGTCRKLVPSGASCSGGEVSCGAGATCLGGSCVTRARVGEACAADKPCVIGARCEGGSCVPPLFVKVGDACDATHRCPVLSTCVSGTCRLDARLGATCSSTTPCGPGWCDGGTCKALLAAGATCSKGSACLSGECPSGSCGAIPGSCFAP